MLKKEVQTSEERKQPLVVGSVTFRSVYDLRVTEEDLEKARRELNETEDKKVKCLKKLKDKLAGERGLICRMDDDYLLRFLRHAKFNCDRAFDSIRKLYSTRKDFPEALTVTPKVEDILTSEFYTYLPYKDENGCMLGLMQLSKWNLDKVSFMEQVQMISPLCDMICANPTVQINGAVAIWDLRGFSLKHAAQIMYPSSLRLLVNLLQDVYPWRIKGGIFIHCNVFLRKVMRVVQPFVKKKVMDRIKFLGSDMSELHQHVNPNLLPKMYGGTLEDSEIKNCMQHTADNLPYIRYERTFGYV